MQSGLQGFFSNNDVFLYVSFKKGSVMTKKQCIHTILFLLLLFVLFRLVTYVLRDKSGAEYIYNFKDEPENSIDVILLGSSHMYRTIQPMELWNDYGIASYNLGSSEQSLPLSYYLLKEAVRKQNPSYVVLDVYMLIMPLKDYTHERVHQVVDNMEWSVNKINAITDIIPPDEWIYYFLNIGQYHSRWSEVTKKDFQKINGITKGSDFTQGHTKLKEPVWEKDEKAEIPKMPFSYLNKIVRLCKENNMKLIFTLMPYAIDTYEEHIGIFNSFEEIAFENDWDYFNMIALSKETGLDWSKDFAETQHVNHNGSRKVTKYLGKLLRNCYQITDHRGENKYHSWNLNFNAYLDYRKKILT